jgi:hypothetical protein
MFLPGAFIEAFIGLWKKTISGCRFDHVNQRIRSAMLCAI